VIYMYWFSGTVVGVRCDDGVALASDSKGVANYHVLSKRVQKVFKLEDKIGAAVAGGTGDVQSLIGLLRAEVNLYRLREGRPISTKSLAQMSSNLLHGRRNFPYIAEGIISGIDDGEPLLYFFDPIGGKLEERKFAAGGTGATVAYGALEGGYKDGIDLNDGARLAAKAIQTAIERDAATGEKIVVAVVDKKGYRELPEDEVEELLGK
jgi:proteasome beta subunit